MVAGLLDNIATLSDMLIASTITKKVQLIAQ